MRSISCRLALCAMGLMVVGCATELKTIPTGYWTGTGSSVVFGEKAGDAASDDLEALGEASYPASMWIDSRKVGGHDLLTLQIFSEHKGETPRNVRLVVNLVPIETGGDGARLYSMLEPKLDVDADKPFEPDAIPLPDESEIQKALADPNSTRAVLLKRERAIVLQIHYVWPDEQEKGTAYSDTILFGGDRACKTGSYISMPQKISWAESLEKVH